MERDFLLPDVGEGLEDATIVQWHVAVGDTVHLNEPLVTIETEKAAVELPSPFEGRVVLLNADEGDELRVGELLARIDTTEDVDARSDQASGTAPQVEPPEEPSSIREPPVGSEAAAGSGSPATQGRGNGDGSSGRQPVLVGYGVDDELPPTRSRQWQRPKSPGGQASSENSEPGGSHVSRPDSQYEQAQPTRPLAKPPVRWLARTLDVDLTAVPPTGPRGEVTREDVRDAVRAPATDDAGELREPAQVEPVRQDELAWWPVLKSASAPVRGTPRPDGAKGVPVEDEGDPGEVPVRGVRARIAERMTLSRSTIPEATCGLWVDCESLHSLRSALQDDMGRSGLDESGQRAAALTPFAVVAWMVPFALQAAPLLNASFDAQAKVIRVYRSVHLGVATSTEQGLLVPVVRDAHELGLYEFSMELARLSRSGREGQLTPAELTGSTFTVTNYGALGLDDGNPVINAPEAAILGVGAMARRATVHEGELAVRSTCKLVCAFDHRVSDGADAARFLRRLKALIERPELILGTR